LGPHGLFSAIYCNPDDSAFEGGTSPLRAVATLGPFRTANLVSMALLGVLFVAMCLRGLWRGIRGFGALHPVQQLALVMSVGLIASAAFTPPWITEGIQLQAATVCFLALLPTVGNLDQTEAGLDHQGFARDRSYAWQTAVASLAAPLVSMLLLRPHREAGTPTQECAQVLETLADTRVEPGTFGYREDSLEENLRLLRKTHTGIAKALDAHIDSVWVAGYDRCSKDYRLMLIPKELDTPVLKVLEAESEGIVLVVKRASPVR
jgi:hypothetical protein